MNNPLAIMKNYLQVLAIRLQGDEEIQGQLRILDEEIDRVGQIVLRLRDQSEEVPSKQAAVDINVLIQDLVTLFEASLFRTHQIEAHLQLDDRIPELLLNRNSLKQVLTNLLKNAVEAQPQGGEIELATRDQVNVDGLPFVEVRIADRGPGIPDELISAIFNPVRSSKGREHAGLGLTIVRNLMTDLQGSISCRNTTDGGAEFILLLPRRMKD